MPKGCFPTIVENDYSEIAQIFSRKEVYDALFQMGPYKALGPQMVLILASSKINGQ